MPNDARRTPGPPPRTPPDLDEVDHTLLSELARDGRQTNVALAAAAGIAESTCIARVRSLRERGVITGFHADVDLVQIGLPVQAMVSVRFSGLLRTEVDRFGREVAALPQVLATYNIAGPDDYLVHLAAASPQALRDFVLDNITGRPGVVHTETTFVFQSLPGSRPLG